LEHWLPLYFLAVISFGKCGRECGSEFARPAVEPDRVDGSLALFLAPQASKVNGHYPYNVATVPLMSELMKFVLSSFLLYQQYSKDRLAAQVRLWFPMPPSSSAVRVGGVGGVHKEPAA
jgi:hypothetical protein